MDRVIQLLNNWGLLDILLVSLESWRAIAHLFIMLSTWTSQKFQVSHSDNLKHCPREDNLLSYESCKIITSKSLEQRSLGMLNNYCGFDIGCSYVSELIMKVSTRRWHIRLLQCHNNLSLMLCIMHELEMNYSPIKSNLKMKMNITKQRLVIWTEKIFLVECYIRMLTSMNIVQRFDLQDLVYCSFNVQEKNCLKSILHKNNDKSKTM